MNEVQVFKFQNLFVRTAEIEGATWFVAKDVCDALEIQNPTDSLKCLDDDERARFNLGRQGDANVINESGLYALILRSNKPNARPFRKWVTSEVLPAIRKTGGYGLVAADTVRLLMEQNDQLKTILRLNARIAELKAAPRYRPLTDDDKAQILALRAEGLGYGRIGAKLGRDKKTVSGFIKRNAGSLA